MTLGKAKRWLVVISVAIAIAIMWMVPAMAQEAAAGAPSAEDANNPLAKFQAFNLHDYYVPSLTGTDQNANTFWLRYAQPIGKWLFRASLPVSKVPLGDGKSVSGLGDFNAFAAYQFDLKPGVSFGIGPQIVIPTASADETGTGRWQGGLSAILFNASSKAVQWGGLVTWQADFAGDANRAAQNVLAVQPFYFVQLGKGLYVRSSGIMAFDLEKHTYNVPIGLGIGQVIPSGKTVYNVFVEPQFSILTRGANQPELQVFVGFNTQFSK